MKGVLTQRQREVLLFIAAYNQRQQSMPTRAQIAAHFSMRSANAAEEHCRALVRRGLMEIVAGAARGLRFTEEGRKVAGLPESSPVRPNNMVALPVCDFPRWLQAEPRGVA